MTDKITISKVVERFARYYQKPGNENWGSLHVVLSDGNNECVEFCKEWAHGKGDVEGEALAEIMLQMTMTQIRKLPRKVYEFIKKENGAVS